MEHERSKGVSSEGAASTEHWGSNEGALWGSARAQQVQPEMAVWPSV